MRLPIVPTITRSGDIGAAALRETVASVRQFGICTNTRYSAAIPSLPCVPTAGRIHRQRDGIN